MSTDMLMPQMGESITEATILRWVKKIGDAVKKDETILEISTDKVDSEIPSPASGVLTEILFKEGDVVPVKVKIALIGESNGGAVVEKIAAKPVEKVAITETPVVTVEKSDKILSPLVKSLAEKHNLSAEELNKISGSGQGGRVNKDDLLTYVNTKSETKSTVLDAPKPASESKPAPAPIAWDDSEVKIVPMDAMRQAIAKHMVMSKQTSPHVYSVQEVDVTAISKWRAKWKTKFQEQEGFNLSFTPFFLEAAVKALVKYPHVNASVDGNKIILKKHINLGCAVSLDNMGLIVPVIKNSEEKNFVGICRGLNDIALRARNKKLKPDDVQGGTFTVTNPGVFGTIIGTPIISQPQVAILCLGAIEKRPVVIDDMIAIRERCYLTLSYDHRIVDGSLGGLFLSAVKEHLEKWDINRPL